MKIIYLLAILIVTCGAASGQTPRTAEGFIDRGIERQGQGDLDGAIEDYTKAISLKPQAMVLAAAYNNRANARIARNDVAGALADYSKAIEVVPTDPENYYNRGVVFLNKSEYEHAIADLIILWIGRHDFNRL